MLGCDHCAEWYHASCIGVKYEVALQDLSLIRGFCIHRACKEKEEIFRKNKESKQPQSDKKAGRVLHGIQKLDQK
jgi:hypothetical protein